MGILIYISVIALFLIGFTYYQYRKDGNLEPKKMILIRRVLFLLILGGAVYYALNNSNNFLTDWVHYVVIIGVYILIDIFFLQGATISEFGTTNKIVPYADSINQKQKLLEALRKKTEDALIIHEEIGQVAYTSNEGYIWGLQEFLNRYCRQQNLALAIHVFDTEEDKTNYFEGSEFLEREQIKIKADLEADWIYFTKDGARALRRIEFSDKVYLLDIVMEEEIDAVFEMTDIYLLDIMFLSYNRSAVNVITERESDNNVEPD